MICEYYRAEKNFLGKVGLCYGTKERDACSCDGDKIKCNFYPTYPTVREEVKKPMTRADCIRSMADEELDKFLGEVQWDVANYCGSVTQKQEYPVPEQRGAWLDWLRQEVKDDKQSKPAP